MADTPAAKKKAAASKRTTRKKQSPRPATRIDVWSDWNTVTPAMVSEHGLVETDEGPAPCPALICASLLAASPDLFNQLQLVAANSALLAERAGSGTGEEG